MLPYLQIGDRQIPVYAICGLLGAGAFALLCLRRAKRFHIDIDRGKSSVLADDSALAGAALV